MDSQSGKIFSQSISGRFTEDWMRQRFAQAICVGDNPFFYLVRVSMENSNCEVVPQNYK